MVIAGSSLVQASTNFVVSGKLAAVPFRIFIAVWAVMSAPDVLECTISLSVVSRTPVLPLKGCCRDDVAVAAAAVLVLVDTDFLFMTCNRIRLGTDKLT